MKYEFQELLFTLSKIIPGPSKKVVLLLKGGVKEMIKISLYNQEITI